MPVPSCGVHLASSSWRPSNSSDQTSVIPSVEACAAASATLAETTTAAECRSFGRQHAPRVCVACVWSQKRSVTLGSPVKLVKRFIGRDGIKMQQSRNSSLCQGTCKSSAGWSGQIRSPKDRIIGTVIRKNPNCVLCSPVIRRRCGTARSPCQHARCHRAPQRRADRHPADRRPGPLL